MKSKNGYYLFFGTNSSGVNKKIVMQMNEFAKEFNITKIDVNKKKRSVFGKIISRLPWCSNGFDYDSVIEKMDSPSFIYVRRVVADKSLLKFFETLKKRFPECRIVIEIFTYPYDKDEFNRNFLHFLKHSPAYLKDVIHRKKLHKYVDRFVTYSDDEMIFGVPTIRTSNGIEFGTAVPVTPKEKGSEEIDLISVAHMQVHHGYERLINGLADYYQNGGRQKFVLHLVGDGEEAGNYKALVKKNGLSDKVIFYGKKTGNELDAVYELGDIAIGSFGLYKYGINMISTLKICEYLAKGLPVITGCKISKVAEEPYFVDLFDNDSKNIDFNRIKEFYDKVYSNGRQNVINDARSFAQENFDMPVVMKPIIDYLREE